LTAALIAAAKHFLPTPSEVEALYTGQNGALLAAVAEAAGDADDRARAADVLSDAPGAVSEAVKRIAVKPDAPGGGLSVLVAALSHAAGRPGDPAARQRAMDVIRALGPRGAEPRPGCRARWPTTTRACARRPRRR
jgi:hypothetical protein